MYNSDELKLFSSRANSGLCSHAYIVDGDNGIGKLDFALECARTMLCTGANKPCGYCEHCVKARSGNHPDIYVIGLERNPLIDDVREIIRRSGLKPNDAEKQIFIVNNAAKLQEPAQNALLKLFEEPPASVAIFLLTDSRAALLPTVLSRGQRIHLDGFRDAEIAERLKEKHPTLTGEELNNLLRIANGSITVAESLVSKERVKLREKAQKMALLVMDKNIYELGMMLIQPKLKRDQVIPILTEFVNLLHEVQKKKYNVRESYVVLNADIAERLPKLSKKAFAVMCEYTLQCIMALENNANVTAVVTKLIIDLTNVVSR